MNKKNNINNKYFEKRQLERAHLLENCEDFVSKGYIKIMKSVPVKIYKNISMAEEFFNGCEKVK